jgi:tetrapyrrole methylase family protein / MazG family protein
MEAPRPAASARLDDPRIVGFARLLGVVDRLRDPDGCPWDRKQTLRTMAPYLVEEAHEAVEAIERDDDVHAAEEAGDVLMVVALICRIAQQEGRFDLARAAQAVSDKLVRRHPHVFGDVNATSADEALQSWEAVKQSERSEKAQDDSAIAGLPISLPALQRAGRVWSKAVSAGFRWESVAGAVDKLAEEQAELSAELEASGLARDAKAMATPEQRARVEHELGDVLLAAAFLAGWLGLEPESVLRGALRRFESRFRAVEKDLPRPMREHALAEIVASWGRAKALEA